MSHGRFLLAFAIALSGLVWSGPLAVVIRTEGKVVMTTDKGDRTPKAGDLILSKWKLTTGLDGQIRLRMLADKTIVDLKPSSQLSLDVLERADRTIRRAFLISGDASFSLSGTSSDFRAETQTSVASGKLAQFGVSTGLDGTTRFAVADGNLSVCNPGTGEHANVWQGSTATSTWDGISDVVTDSVSRDTKSSASAPIDSTFGLEVRMIDPSSGAASSLRYGLEKGR